MTKPEWPIGATKKGKIKVKDGTTGKTSWRQGTTGMSRDWDGDPIAANYNREGLKRKPKHTPHQGKREKAYERSSDE